MQIVLFQTIQFNMSTQFNCQNISISSYSVYSNSSNSANKLFNAKSIFKTNNQFYFKQFSLAWVQFNGQKHF